MRSERDASLDLPTVNQPQPLWPTNLSLRISPPYGGAKND